MSIRPIELNFTFSFFVLLHVFKKQNRHFLAVDVSLAVSVASRARRAAGFEAVHGLVFFGAHKS